MGAQAPVGDLRFIDDETVVVGGFEARAVAGGAIDIRSVPAFPANDVMVIIADPRLVAGGVSGGLDATDEAGFDQRVQVVIDGLGRECSKALSGNVCDDLYVQMLLLSLDGGQDSQARRRDAKSRGAKTFSECGRCAQGEKFRTGRVLTAFSITSFSGMGPNNDKFS